MIVLCDFSYLARTCTEIMIVLCDFSYYATTTTTTTALQAAIKYIQF